jgi:hypothetical protein
MPQLLAKSLADFSQSRVKTKVSCSQNNKHGTAEPFHFLNTSPIGYVTMLRRLCVGNLGHAMFSYATVAGQKFGRFQPKPSQNQGFLQPEHQAWHC